MKRRRVLMLLGAAAAGWPLGVRAQPPDRVRRIGALLPYIESDAQAQARLTAFLGALQERGWVEGQNVRLAFRYAEGQPERLPALAAELVQSHVDVLLTPGTEATDIARRATTTIPIVMAAVGDPLAAGFIASLAHPGGNVTGSSLLATEQIVCGDTVNVDIDEDEKELTFSRMNPVLPVVAANCSQAMAAATRFS